MAVTQAEWGEWEEDLTVGMVTQWHDLRVTYRWEFSTWSGTGRVWVRVFTSNGQRAGWPVGPTCPNLGHRTLAHYRTEVQASVERWWAEVIAVRFGARL